MLDNYYDCIINLFLQEKMFDLINLLLGSLSEGKKREVKSEYINCLSFGFINTACRGEFT